LKESKKEWDQNISSRLKQEQDMRDEIRVLHDQLERARRDMEYVFPFQISSTFLLSHSQSLTISSMTQSFPSSEIPSESAATLQARLTSLSQVHKEATSELANKEIEITKLYTRLSDSTNAAQVTISQISKEKIELERELRWAKQGRAAAEKAEGMAKKELETYLQYQDTGVSSLFIVL
jgi:mitotic spindle assembly checkpoint protein MAD1